MPSYIRPGWVEILASNDLAGFDALWNLDSGWFEEPNWARGGWSGVLRTQLQAPDGRVLPVFVKRQENYRTRGLRHPICGEPTFAREWRNLKAFESQGIASQTWIYYGQRKLGTLDRAILVTQELHGYVSLEELVGKWKREGWPSLMQEKRLIIGVAGLLRHIHQQRWMHGALYPKHLFLNSEMLSTLKTIGPRTVAATGRVPQVCIIDLEKTKRSPLRLIAMIRDFEKLSRRLPELRTTTLLRFYKSYLRCDRLSLPWRLVLEVILRRSAHRDRPWRRHTDRGADGH